MIAIMSLFQSMGQVSQLHPPLSWPPILGRGCCRHIAEQGVPSGDNSDQGFPSENRSSDEMSILKKFHQVFDQRLFGDVTTFLVIICHVRTIFTIILKKVVAESGSPSNLTALICDKDEDAGMPFGI